MKERIRNMPPEGSLSVKVTSFTFAAFLVANEEEFRLVKDEERQQGRRGCIYLRDGVNLHIFVVPKTDLNEGPYTCIKIWAPIKGDVPTWIKEAYQQFRLSAYEGKWLSTDKPVDKAYVLYAYSPDGRIPLSQISIEKE